MWGLVSKIPKKGGPYLQTLSWKDLSVCIKIISFFGPYARFF